MVDEKKQESMILESATNGTATAQEIVHRKSIMSIWLNYPSRIHVISP
jgi:hypothetical protein